MLVRGIASLTLVLSVFILPWWLTLSAGILFSFVMPRYWEVVPIGLLFDALYGTPTTYTFTGTLVAIALFFFFMFLRDALRL